MTPPPAALTFVLGLLMLATPLAAQVSSRVRVTSTRPSELSAELEDAGFDVLPGTLSEGAFELVVSLAEEHALRARGLDPELLERGRPYRQIAAEQGAAGGPEGTPPGGYPDLAAVNAQLLAFAAAWPGICQVVDVTAAYGSPTFEGRSILVVKISDNVATDEDEPNVLVVSAHHCREIVTPVIALKIIERLLTGYGVDPGLTTLVDENEIWVAPVWNPDGYEHVFAVDNLWRKNRRVFAQGIGVDLNRNYPFGWSATCSGSSSVTSNTYKGPGPASEPETATMIAFARARNFDKVLDYHSSGQEVLWGYDCSTHPLSAWLQAEAIALSFASGYQGAERSPSAEGEHYEWELALLGSYAFLIEVATTFQPTYALALEEAALVWPGVLFWLQRPISVRGHVRDACTGLPLVAGVTPLGLGFQNGERQSSGGAFGRYHLFLPDGSYSVRFSAPGYLAQNQQVTVSGGRSTALDVALQPVSPAGCWEELGGGTTGIAGPPTLVGTGSLEANSTASLSLTNAPAGGLLLAWLSLTSVPLSFFGGTIHANPFTNQFLFFADGSGEFDVSTTWPAGVPSGTDAWFQFLLADNSVIWGITLSNALKATTP